MTDRPDPFDDLEFETAEPIGAEEVAARETAPAPQPKPAVKANADPAADPGSSEETPGPAAAVSSNIVAYATLALSGLAFAGTFAAVTVTLATARPEPRVSPEHAAIGRIEALLTGQQARLDHMAALAAQPTAAQPQAGADALPALSVMVRANQVSLDKIPALLSQQLSRMQRATASVPERPVAITRTLPAPASPGSSALVEVMKTQAAIQRQLDALAAKIAKTTAACVAQTDGTIRYP